MGRAFGPSALSQILPLEGGGNDLDALPVPRRALTPALGANWSYRPRPGAD